jgi:ferredoxin
MSGLQSASGDDLRAWLDHVNGRETAKWLMLGIAYDEGIDVADLAAWYGLEESEVEAAIDAIETDPLPVWIAEREGVDFSALADRSGLGRRTIVDWFEALGNQPVERSADIISRYSQRRTGPLLRGTTSRVHYLDYAAVEEHGWSLEDDDLFAKASDAGLEPAQYGRFLVKAGETILEAAENRGIDWPYACRGGACANCAVIVKSGDVAMPGQTILTEDQVQLLNARLTCVGVPVTEELKLVMNVQHLEELQDLRLPSPMTHARPAL